jgi:hypothetical protein
LAKFRSIFRTDNPTRRGAAPQQRLLAVKRIVASAAPGRQPRRRPAQPRVAGYVGGHDAVSPHRLACHTVLVQRAVTNPVGCTLHDPVERRISAAVEQNESALNTGDIAYACAAARRSTQLPRSVQLQCRMCNTDHCMAICTCMPQAACRSPTMRWPRLVENSNAARADKPDLCVIELLDPLFRARTFVRER